jgi:Tfp pilus assembly protein PilO
MKIVLAIVIIFLIALGFWLLDWQEKLNNLNQLETTLTQRQNKLKDSELLVNDLPKETDRNDRLTKELKSLIKERFTQETADEFVPSYLTEIEKLVEFEKSNTGDQSFQILSLTPGVLSSGGGKDASKEKQTDQKALKDYPTRTFQMSMRGKYATLIDFLRQLGALKLKRLVTINKISLAPVEESKSGESPVLAITIPITAYLRQGGGPQ